MRCPVSLATTVFVTGSIRSRSPEEATHTASSVAAIRLRQVAARNGISAAIAFVAGSIRTNEAPMIR